MLKNMFSWLYRKPQIEKLHCDFEEDTTTTIPITTMDDATHELTEDLIPSGFSTLKYPKGTQIKEVPKDSSLRHFLFPDGKTGWVDEMCVRSLVTEKVTTPTPSDVFDSNGIPQIETLFGRGSEHSIETFHDRASPDALGRAIELIRESKED